MKGLCSHIGTLINLTTLLWVFGYCIVIAVVVFYSFFLQFCDLATLGNHLQEEFTKFGYRSDRKVGKKKTQIVISISGKAEKSCTSLMYYLLFWKISLVPCSSGSWKTNNIVCFHFFNAS
jgi:hypothetical protein